MEPVEVTVRRGWVVAGLAGAATAVAVVVVAVSASGPGVCQDVEVGWPSSPAGVGTDYPPALVDATAGLVRKAEGSSGFASTGWGDARTRVVGAELVDGRVALWLVVGNESLTEVFAFNDAAAGLVELPVADARLRGEFYDSQTDDLVACFAE